MRGLLVSIVILSACGGKKPPAKCVSCTSCPCPALRASPIGLSATGSDARINLNWQTVAEASSYTVLRSTTPGSDYKSVGSAAASAFVDTSVTDRITYYYVVQAVNATGASPSSAEVSATPYFLNQWRERRYAPELFSGAYGNGTYLALGLEGAALTSSDATTWAIGTTGLSETGSAVVFAAGKFLTISSSGTVASSGDGSTWTTTRTGQDGESAQLLAYGNGIWVAMGGGGFGASDTLLNSVDGVQWTSHSTGHYHSGLTFDGSAFVSVAPSLVEMSTDGAHWSDAPLLPTLTGVNFNCVASDLGGTTVAMGSAGAVLTGKSGVWSLATPLGTAVNWHRVAFGGGRFVALDDLGDFSISSDGVNWSALSPISSGGAILSNLFYGGGRFVGLGSAQTTGTLADASSAFVIKAGDGLQHFYGAASSPSFLVVVGDAGAILTSSDAATWTLRDSHAPSGFFRAVAAGNGWVAVGDDGLVDSSSDGLTWQNHPAFATSTLSVAVAFKNKFVAAGSAGTVASSADGITWQSSSLGASVHFHSLQVVGDSLIAFGSDNGANPSGAVSFTSPDAVVWTPHPVTSDVRLTGLNRMVHAQGLYVGVGSDENYKSARIVKSKDGLVWSQVDVGVLPQLHHIVYSGSSFVAVGDDGIVLSSSDAQHWARRPTGVPTVASLLALISPTPGAFLAVGIDELILTSP